MLVGRCWEAGGAPAYWPWVQALRGYVRECESDELRRQLGARVYTPTIAGIRDMFDRAAARGEITPDAAPAPAMLLNTIAGTVVGNILMFGGDLATLEGELVNLLLHGCGNGQTREGATDQ